MSDTLDLLAQAITNHGAGRLDVAEHLYRAVLALDPQDAEANHGFGALIMELGQIDLGLMHLRKALENAPETGRYWLGLAEGFLIAQRPEEALVVIERALAIGLDTAAARDVLERSQLLAARVGAAQTGD